MLILKAFTFRDVVLDLYLRFLNYLAGKSSSKTSSYVLPTVQFGSKVNYRGYLKQN